jgi:cyclopropane-fatty-acyl-phospholipid synthase
MYNDDDLIRNWWIDRTAEYKTLDPRVKKSIFYLLNRLPISILIEQNAGSIKLGKSNKPPVKIRVNDETFWYQLLKEKSRALGLSYANGSWDTDQLVKLLIELTVARKEIKPILDALVRLKHPLKGNLSKLFHKPDLDKDRTDIHLHYDLSNSFFELLLDPETMNYSCAIFARDDSSLGDAQINKLKTICEKLNLDKKDHLLEIGTGWAGLAMYAAKNYGCKVTTTTISKEQFEYANSKVKQNDLQERITVLNSDYRLLDGKYDKLVSVEMIEAIDWKEQDGFIKKCSQLLTPGGLMLLQAIVMNDRDFETSKHFNDFIRGVIFPGSCLPSVASILKASNKLTDLNLIDLEDIGKHYVKTLAAWRRIFMEEKRQEFENLAQLKLAPGGPFFTRLWEFYLAYCEAGFTVGHISDVQMLFSKPKSLI